MNTKVVLIGGAPGAGKTTLGTALATRLGITSLTIDDLQSGALAITTPETHPKLHVMRKVPSLEYFTNQSLNQLKLDATQQHEAVWPMIQRVVHKHANWGAPIVIEGWYLRPNWVAQLNLKNVWSCWIVTSAAVLEEREKAVTWYQGSTDPNKMRENFLSRSLWYNNLIKDQATAQNMTILFQSGQRSVDDLCERVLEVIDS